MTDFDPMTTPQRALTQLEFDAEDHDLAEKIARKLGYEQFAYTSTSALWGLYCIGENPRTARPGQRTDSGCIVKTKELGLLFVQHAEDLGFGYDWEGLR